MQTQDKLMSPKEVSHFLNIGDSTMRKWCLALEERGYNFMRTDQNKRLFSEKDQFVLGKFKVLVKDKNLSINNAAEILADKYSNDMVFSDETEESRLPEQQIDNSSEILNKLNKIQSEMEQLKSINRTLLVKLDEQQKYIEERDHQILEALKESQESKQLLLEMKEDQEQEKEKQTKRGWRNWFK